MKKLKHLLLLSLLIANNQRTVAQQSNPSNEKQGLVVNETVFIHPNATTFVTGETLYYKLYCLNRVSKAPSTISKIAYIELIDSDKKSVFKNKHFLEKSNGQGDYFVPTTLKSGNYKLIGYTNWMLNQPVSEIFQMDIIILNPFQSNNMAGTTINTSDLSVNSNNAQPIEIENTIENKNITLSLDKKTFTTREKIDLKMTSLDPLFEKGNYSLSVRKTDSLPAKKIVSSNKFAQNSNSTIIENEGSIVLPELRGEMISGKITAKNGSNDIQNVLIGLSIPGRTFAFKVAKTDQNGNFVFNLDKPYYSSNIVMQIMDENPKNYSIILDTDSKVDYKKIEIKTSLKLTAELKENLLNRSVATQIENAYYHKKNDSIASAKSYNSFYESVAKEYLLDDYARFSTLKETSTEIVKEMYYQQKDKNYTLHVRDMSIYTQLPEPALVLVDGLLIKNANELFEYNMKNIHKISIIPGLYYLGPKAFNGMISFTTKNNDYVSKSNEESSLKAAVLRPTIKKTYFKPDYSVVVKNDRIPDYRYQLLWLPEITLDQKENQISFYSSDVTGTFEIALEGFTENGTPVSLRETFEVK